MSGGIKVPANVLICVLISPHMDKHCAREKLLWTNTVLDIVREQ